MADQTYALATDGVYGQANGVYQDVLDAIPDSAIGQFDAQAISGLSDGDTVSTWTNQQGSADATAGTAPTYRASAINGYASVEFDGADDYLTAALGSHSQPNTFILVYEQLTVSSGTTGYVPVDAGTGEAFHFYRQRESEFQHFAGSGLNGGSPSGNPELGTLVFDGANAELRLNGSSVATGDIGTNGLVDLTLGMRSDSSQYFDGYLGEVMVYNDTLSASDIDAEESRLADKWGITI